MSIVLDEEQTLDAVKGETASATADEAYIALLARLSRQSVTKHFDAYADIAWDDPEMAIDPADPRWELDEDDPLGATEWYQSQPPEIRAGIGLHRATDAMKAGLQFENVLKRGILEYAFRLPNGSPEFRYAYHEVAEETHHGMMFQEFVNRSGLNPRGLPPRLARGTRRVVLLGRHFPAMFFLFVLGGEDPIDNVQRKALRRGGKHPLLTQIMRHHVTEEARHLSFARSYLKREVARIGPVRRIILGLATPLLLGQMAAQMLRVSKSLVKTYDIPRRVVRDAYRTPAARAQLSESVRKVRGLCVELRIVKPLSKLLWKLNGIWAEPGTDAAAPG